MPLIAVDAMGGDSAPREIVEGALLAAENGVDVVLVGDVYRHAITQVGKLVFLDLGADVVIETVGS